jgi:serine/threonine protein kinase
MDFGFVESGASPAFATRRTKEIASWYMPGLVDGLGDRLLMFDDIDTEPLEVLRFHPEVSSNPRFEEKLRQRVTQLAHMNHPAFQSIRTVQRLGSDNSLALVSTHTPGKRLSAFFSEDRPRRRLTPRFVIPVLRQILEGLSVLRCHGQDIAHSALTADRIIFMSGGRIRITEHVLGSALAQLCVPRTRLWRDFGLLVPSDCADSATLDQRGDVFQVAIIGLTMLRGRPLTLSHVDGRLAQILDQCSDSVAVGSDVGHKILRAWLERGLGLTERSYRSTDEAYDDLIAFTSDPVSAAVEMLGNPDCERPRLPPVVLPTKTIVHAQEVQVPNDSLIKEVRPQTSTRWVASSAARDCGVADVSPLATVIRQQVRAERPLPNALQVDRDDAPAPATRRILTMLPRETMLFLVVIALFQGVVIAMLLMRSSPVVPSSGPAPNVLRPAVLTASANAQPLATSPSNGMSEGNVNAVGDIPSLNSARLPSRGSSIDPDTASAIERAGNNQRSGGVRLSAPIELKVLQGERVIGSSADGPVVMTAGTHVLDLINPALGFRARQAVTFRAGQIITLPIPIPTGRISINAQPWAEVWIDDRPMGDTPLANVDVPLGERQIVYRHPQLGERRQSVIVRADTPARVSVDLDR